MGVVKYTPERIRECFMYPRTFYAAGVFLGCSPAVARNLIKKNRDDLVVGDWVLYEGPGYSKWVGVYMWKIHPGLEDKPQPPHPNAGLSGSKATAELLKRALEAAKTQLKTSLLLAQNEDEVKKAYRDYDTDYQRIYRKRQRTLGYFKNWYEELKASEARLNLLMEARATNQPEFTQRRTA